VKRHHDQRTGANVAVAVDGPQRSGEVKKEGGQPGDPCTRARCQTTRPLDLLHLQRNVN